MENLLSSKPGVRELLATGCMVLACLSLLLVGSLVGVASPQDTHALAWDPNPPSQTVKLIPPNSILEWMIPIRIVSSACSP